jgi:LysR family hydrogen peroxide-inducible transcriptional activator
MNLRDFEYVEAVARLGNFGKAALACNVSQPTLSMQIRKLEEYLGITLFERTNKSVKLTRTGEAMLVKIRDILQQTSEIKSLAALAKDPFAGEIRLGLFPTLAPYLLPHIMPAMRKTFPKLDILLFEEKTDRLLSMLSDGEIDGACIALPVQAANMRVVPLFKEPFTLAVSALHPLAKRKTIRAADLSQENILLLDEGHCLRDQALEVCSRVGVGESKQFRATSLETLRHMVASNLGITFMPLLAAQSKTKGLSIISFQSTAPFREIGLLWRNQSSRTQALSGIANIIREKMREILH